MFGGARQGFCALSEAESLRERGKRYDEESRPYGDRHVRGVISVDGPVFGRENRAVTDDLGNDDGDQRAGRPDRADRAGRDRRHAAQ